MPVGLFTQDDISHAFISSKSILGLPPFDLARPVTAVVRVVVFKMSSEVFEWLRSISNGLNLERLAKEFEVRGFLTRQSLKYIQNEDLDAFFPSPQKLLLAERRILQTEINNLKEPNQGPNLPPRELFPPVQDRRQAYPSVATQFQNETTGVLPALPLGTSSASHLPRATTTNLPYAGNAQPSTSSQPSSSYLDRRQVQLTEDVNLMQVQLDSAKHQLALRKKEIDECDSIADKRAKICSVCHLPGHTKPKCKNGSCTGFHTCRLPAKHPEVSKELQELKNLIKDLEKKEAKAKNDLELFSSARQRAASSFFAVMRPRLRKQNPIKYIDRSALDKDLLVLKKALGNKIPLTESKDWELPFIIERFKHSNIDVHYL